MMLLRAESLTAKRQKWKRYSMEPPKKRGRPPGSQNKPKAPQSESQPTPSLKPLQNAPAMPTQSAAPSALPTPAERPPPRTTKKTIQGPRSLPENPADLDTEIRPYKVLVRPIVQGLSKVSTVLGADKFDSDEIEGGVQALAALAYQERAEVNAWWLVSLWSLSVSAPRIISAVADYEDRKAARSERVVPYVLDKVQPERPANMEPAAQTLTVDKAAFLDLANNL